jgi:hypothetical protein
MPSTVADRPESLLTAPIQPLFDVHDVAARLKCSWRHALRLADRGEMPFGHKLGALRRWDPREIEDWIASGCPRVR